MSKILGKYEIIKNLGQNRYRAKCLNQEFEILQLKRNVNNESLSYTASKLSNLSHQHLRTIKLEEDEKNFYLIKECFSGLKILDSKVFMRGNNVDYKNLFECYLQLWDAISYIDRQGYYHGNINPSNILVDTQNAENYRLFLLDFGRSYYYNDFYTQQNGLRFFAPEQLEQLNRAKQNNQESDSLDDDLDYVPDIRSDVFAFGLCMLNILLDNFEDCNALKSYKKPQDLEAIFNEVLNDYECEGVEKDILLLVKKCCAINPESRISLHDLRAEILDIYDEEVPRNIYDIKCENNVTLSKYAENNDLDPSDFSEIREHIQERIDGYTAFIRQIEVENNDGENESKLEIAINDLIFICQAKNDDYKQGNRYLWVYQVRENELTRIEKIIQNGLELKHKFIFTTKGYSARGSKASNISKLLNELDYRFKTNKLEVEQKRIDTKAILSEESLLEAEEKDINSKKKTHFAKLLEIKKGANAITFALTKKEKDDNSDKKENKEESNTQESNRLFKPNEDVVIKEIQDKDNDKNKEEYTFKGKVVSYAGDKKEITIKLIEKNSTLFDVKIEKELKTKRWQVEYDYQVREILWSKRNTALEQLKKGNTQIPNLLRKINEPKELKANVLIELDANYNQNLDTNQKEAVRKALSLETDCEILLVQGPPGTGKTTTITEIIKQYQNRHKHYKILITSQSNQAVDNVLEKICVSESNKDGEDKIFRIGNDKSKMSEVATQYTPEIVLDKILQSNRDRLSQNIIRDSNPNIESKLQELQKRFLIALEKLSSNIGTSDSQRNKEMFNLFTKDVRLFFGTLLGISSWTNFRDVAFDLAIVDEAGRATLSELLVPCIKAKKIILVGDHKQLAPVVDDDVVEKLSGDSNRGGSEFKANKKDVTTSLFERLFERIESNLNRCEHLDNVRHTLTYNYRAHKSICDLYSNAFYKGALQTKPEISAKKAHNLKVFKSNAIWLDTSKKHNRQDEQRGTGKINRCNAHIIYHTLNGLKDEVIKVGTISDMGIITPYKAQAQELQAKLKDIIKKYDQDGIKIDIGTVDSFQGSDRDIIIYDCVRSSAMKNTKKAQKNRQGSKIDFIADEKRLNVSLSRSKKLLIIVGDKEYLRTASVSEGKNPFSLIIEAFDDTKSYQVIDNF